MSNAGFISSTVVPSLGYLEPHGLVGLGLGYLEPHGLVGLVPVCYPFALFVLGSPYENRVIGKRVPLLLRSYSGT